MADVKWIKIATNVFDNRKIRQIECLPDGDGMIVVWFKLLCLAGNINDGGMVYFTKDIPYTEKMLATEFNRPLALIQVSLRTFCSFGMIEIVENLLRISNWERYQNLEAMERIKEQTRARVAKHRDKQRLLEAAESNVTGNVTVTRGNATDIDIEVDIEEEVEDINSEPVKKKQTAFHPPTLPEIEAYCRERGNSVDAKRFFDYYEAAEWKDQNGKQVRNWKQKMIAVWERKDTKQERKGEKDAPVERDYTTAPDGMRLIL